MHLGHTEANFSLIVIFFIKFQGIIAIKLQSDRNSVDLKKNKLILSDNTG